VLVFLGALFYFLLFHRYGFFLQDEGVIAYQALRVSRGELPYADFQTAYTPAGYYLHALIFVTFGPSLVALRVTAAIAAATTAALLFLAARQVLPAAPAGGVAGPRWSAFLPSVLYVLLADQDSAGHVPHTMAYPARYLSTLWAASLCLTLAHARRPRGLVAILLGLVTAAITAFKHTGGAYNAWAVGLSLVLIGLGSGSAAARRPSPPPRRLAAVPILFLAAVLVALPVLFGGVTTFRPSVTLVFSLPLAAAVVVLAGTVWPWGRGGRAAAGRLSAIGRHLLAFGLTAMLPTMMWILFFGDRAGFGLLGQRLVFDGPAVARSYTIPFPAPTPLASGLVALAAVMVVGRLAAGRRPGSALWAAAWSRRAALGLGFAGGLWLIVELRGLVGVGKLAAAADFVGRQGDNALFYLIPIVSYAFLPRLIACVRRPPGAGSDLTLVCWLHGLCQILLAYPRLDVAHLYEGFVILLVPATVLLQRTLAFAAARAPEHRPGVRWPGAAVTAAVAVLLLVKLAPRVAAQIEWRDGPVRSHRTELAGPRGGLYDTPAGRTDPSSPSWFGALNRTVAYVRRHTSPAKPIFTYPALAGVYFLSERDNPTEMDYFHRGFGEGRDEVDVITRLEAEQVPLVVMMDDASFDPPDGHHYPMLKDYLRRHFAQVRVYTPFRILERVAP
jgi:hypothetical protein